MLSGVGFAAEPRSQGSSRIQPWPLEIPANGPLDDAANESLVKLLPRKPPAIEERPGDRHREIRYIDMRALLAARLRPRRDCAEPVIIPT